MLDGVIGGGALAASPWVLLAITVWLLLSGQLVPRRTVQDVREDRDTWRKAHETSEAARIEQGRQIDQMIDSMQTVEQVVRALPTRQPGRGGR